jgi:alpha-glucosidase
MPWDAGPGGGFTTGRPWLPIGDGNRPLNVAAQRDDRASMLTLHRRLLRLRRRAPALVTGSYHPVEADGDVLAYLRTGPGDRWLVALNLGPGPARLALPGPAPAGRVALSTTPDRDGQQVGDVLDLGGDEGVVVELG